MSKPLKLKICSKTESLVEVRNFVSEAALNFGFDEETANKIVLAVDEACTNIIKHAYKYVPDKIIEIEVRPNSEKFEVKLTDYGISFDPRVVKTPNIKSSIMKYRKGGLGMYLMKSLVDKVEYNMNQNRRNTVRIIKYKN
ncbi:MAG: ATP-binding protein [Bacteroidota bacterium]|nr:ATP-binding protein [Bacteroidota bacterium]